MTELEWRAAHPHDTFFEIGARVRYRPGIGTYGYEDKLGADGRAPGIVVGHTPTRVRVDFTGRGRGLVRPVDPGNLALEGDLRG